MTIFDDVHLNYERIASRYQRLAFLLIKKLIKYKVQINPNDDISFKQLVHKVDTINVKKEYDYEENIKPSDKYVSIKAIQKYTGQDVSIFNQALSYRTKYYIRWLRYYLAKKGVDLSLINKAVTLEEHIYLIDFIAQVKNTNINIIVNDNNQLYYGQNTFQISVIDEDGNYITEGKLEFEQDGLRIIQDLTDTIIININDLNEHTFKFKYYNDDDINHYDSETILTLTAQPRPITFTASLINTQQRDYINNENILKGYIEDIWLLEINTLDQYDNPIPVSRKIKIYDEYRPRIIETDENENNIIFEKHNSENDNQPIHVLVEVQDNPFYIFNTRKIEFNVNVLHPYCKGEITPASDYTGQESYDFEINMYDEFTGELVNNYDDVIIDIDFFRTETIITEEMNEEETALEIQEEVQVIQVHKWENVNINEGIINLNYQGNLLVDEHQMHMTLTTPDRELYQDFFINILPNYLYSEYIYLMDEPYIQILNDKTDGLSVEITKVGITIDEETGETTEEELSHIIITDIILDEDNNIILPSEFKELGTYHVNIVNTNTEENISYTYIVDEPYTYTYEYVQTVIEQEPTEPENTENPTNPYDQEEEQEADPAYDLEEIEEPEYIILKTSVIFHIQIDSDNFNFNNITDYIKIYEYNKELEYEYYGGNDSVTVIADVLVNKDFKGINTFWININGYEKTETFTLLNDDDGMFEVTSDLELGDNEVIVSYYGDSIDTILVSIYNDNDEQIGNHLVSRVDEDFIFNQNFPEVGYYTFVIKTGSEIEEEYTFYIGKNKLKIQDFKFNNKISNEETPDEFNCLGFGFTNKNKIDEDILITFWCDDPSNILYTDVINAQDSEYYTYLDIFLGDLGNGPHTIHIQYDGNSDYYQAFDIIKEIVITKPAKIVYDKEFNTIGFGDIIQLYLLTLDSQNNIIQKGQYIINDVYYELNDEITITPESIGEYYINVTYTDDTDEYIDVNVSIKYIVEPDSYDYYASSLMGSNTNSGTNPMVPVKDIETLLEISQANDLLCLMAGEYSIQTITRDTIFYGYHQDSIEDIKANILEITPNTTLTLYNIMLDTGNGYTPITGSYKFVNSGDETAELSAVPSQQIISITHEDVYKIKSKTRIARENPITITGKIVKNQIPIQDKLIRLYDENDNLIKATVSDSNGKFTFNVYGEDIDLLRIKATNCEKVVLMEDIKQTYNWEFDGTETIQTINGTVSTGDGILTGGTGYVSNFAWSNDGLWELNCEIKIKSWNRFTLYQQGDTQERDWFRIQSNGVVTMMKIGHGRLEITIPDFNLAYDFTPITIKKTSDTTVDIIWPNGTYTITNNYWFAFSEFCIGTSTHDGIYVRNASVTYDNVILSLTTSYAPLLNGTEEVITTEGTVSYDLEDYSMWATNSYLTEGFDNTDYWEITLDATYWGYAQNTGISIVDKNAPNDNILHIRGDGEVWNKSGDIIFNDGVMNINSTILDKNSGFSTITIQRISPKTIKFKFDDSKWGKILWQSLSNIETLCIGIYRNVYNSGMGIKNINVKTEE